MATQNRGKLNRLLAELGDSDFVSARWLRSHGYSSALVAGYFRNGWVRSPARGVYMAANGVATWEGVLHSLQQRERLRLHAGGRFALALHGHEHYLRMSGGDTIDLFGPDRLPGWTTPLKLEESFRHAGNGPFPPAGFPYDDATTDELLASHGLERLQVSSSVDWVVIASAERAMLELCGAVRDAAGVHEAHATLQGMSGVRPSVMAAMLLQCNSIKAKRLFLALASRTGHAWLDRLDASRVELGRGKRALVPGGKLDVRYQITLPADLEASLG